MPEPILIIVTSQMIDYQLLSVQRQLYWSIWGISWSTSFVDICILAKKKRMTYDLHLYSFAHFEVPSEFGNAVFWL